MISYAVNHYPVIDSTNREALDRAAQGASEGTVILADRQEQGRGRRGHSFFSPDSGLYLSVILRPSCMPDHALYITTAAAVAAAQAIEQVAGVSASIKWVNDIYCRNRKVCGILTESVLDHRSGRVAYAILGIGFNVYPPEDGFPAELSGKAGSVFDTSTDTDKRQRLAESFLSVFADLYDRLEDKPFLEEYRRRSFLINRPVQVLTSTGTVMANGIVRGITEEFSLTVQYPNGTCCDLSSGDVSVSF